MARAFSGTLYCGASVGTVCVSAADEPLVEQTLEGDVVVMAREGKIKQHVEVGNPHRCVNLLLTADQLLDSSRLAGERVLIVADDFFQDIFQRDDALRTAIFVDHDRHLLPGKLEFLEQTAQCLASTMLIIPATVMLN